MILVTEPSNLISPMLILGLPMRVCSFRGLPCWHAYVLYNMLHIEWHYIPLMLSRVKHPPLSEKRLDCRAMVK